MANASDWTAEVDLLWPSREDMLLLSAAVGPVSDAADQFERWKLARGFTQYREIDYQSSRLLPLVWDRLGREACGDRWAPQMAALRRYHWVHNAARERDLLAVVRQCNAADIVPLLLKGNALVLGGYYEDRGLRPMLDADLMVASHEVARTQAVLSSMGYRRPKRKRGRGFPLAHAEMWRSATDREIDLHLKLLPYPYPPIRAEEVGYAAVEKEVSGARLRIPQATEMLLHAAVHARIFSSNDAARSLIWVADCLRILESGSDAIDWDRLESLAVQASAVLPLRDTLGYLSTRFSAPVPSDRLAKLAAIEIGRAESRPFYRRVGPRNRYPTAGELWENAWDDYRCHAQSQDRIAESVGFLGYCLWRILTGVVQGVPLKYACRLAWWMLREGRAAWRRPNLADTARARIQNRLVERPT